MKRLTQTLLIVALFGAGAAAADIEKLTPRESTYELHMGPLTLGEAQFSLEPNGAQNCYRYQYTANPSGIAKMFVGQIHELTDFCASDAGLQSQRYEFHRADRANKDYVLLFDWSKKIMTGGDPAEQKLPPGTLDRLAIQQGVRLWVIAHAGEAKPAPVEFSMADRTRVTSYKFAISGHEKVEVPAGEFETIVVDRTDDPKKTLRFYLAPGRGYTPVKVIQDAEGQPALRMYLVR